MAAYSDEGQWRWRKQIVVRGRKVRGSGTPPVNTKRAAEAAEAEWITKATGGGPLRAGEVPTLDKVKKDFLDHLEMHKAPSTLANRRSALKKHVSPWFGRMRLDQIGPVDVDRFKKAQVAAGHEPSTINFHVRTLTNLLRWAVSRGYLAEPPEVEVLPVADGIEDVKHLEQAELDAELAKVDGDLHTMILVAAHTGLRAEELLSLRWSDVDLKGRRMTVRHNNYRGTDRPPKNKKERVVPLSATAHDALKSHRHLRGPIVFSDAGGAKVPYSTAYKRLRASTGIEGWHVLRHTFGTRLASRGVPLKAIQAWMGHASIETTMIYARYSPTLDDAIGVLDGGSWQAGANASARKEEAE